MNAVPVPSTSADAASNRSASARRRGRPRKTEAEKAKTKARRAEAMRHKRAEDPEYRAREAEAKRRRRRRVAEQARRAANRTSETEDQLGERRRQAQQARRAAERAEQTNTCAMDAVPSTAAGRSSESSSATSADAASTSARRRGRPPKAEAEKAKTKARRAEAMRHKRAEDSEYRAREAEAKRRWRYRLAEQAGRAAKRTFDRRPEQKRQAQKARRAAQGEAKETDEEESSCLLRFTKYFHFRCCSCGFVSSGRRSLTAHLLAYAEDSAILQERAQPMAEPPAAAVPFATPSGNPLQGVASNQHPPPASKRPRAVLTGQPHVLQPCEARAVPSFALPLLPHPAAQQLPASQGCLRGAPPHPLPVLRPLLLSSVPRNMAAPEASISSAAATSAVAKPGPRRQYTADELRERKNAARRAKRKAAKSTIVVKSPKIQRAERAAAQRAGRRILPIRKREAEPDFKSKLLKRQEASLSSATATSEVAKYIEEADGEESICLLRFSKDFHFRCCSCAFVTSGRWSITTHLLAYAAGLGCQIWKETSNPTKTVDDSWFSCCFCGHASGDQRAIIGHLIAHSADRLTILAPALRGPLFQGARLESAHRGS